MKLLILLVITFYQFQAFSGQNEVKQFVYQWFSQFDQNAETEKFLKHLPDKKFLIRFPEVELRSHSDFKVWYANILKTFKKANHELEFVTVEEDRGQFNVDLVVVWSAEAFDGKRSKLRVHQRWVVLEEPNKNFLIQSNIVDSTFNKIAHRLRQKKASFGGFITIPHGKVIENMTMTGHIDFTWLEAEHSEIGPSEVQQLVIVSENQKITPIVRVPDNDPNLIKKYIGTGVAGVIVPNIKTAKDAERAVMAVKYAPLGQRPVGVERANGYLLKVDETIATANSNVLLILMLETKEAVQNIDSILRVKGVDAVHVGPYDLSMSMGVKRDSAELSQAIATVEKAAQKYEIPLGSAAPNYNAAMQMTKRGYYFFTITGDMEILRNGVKEFFKDSPMSF